MTMDYNEEFAVHALNQIETPDGQPVFEHASEALRLLYTLDVHNYVEACAKRNPASMKALFSSSAPGAVDTLKLAEGTDAPFGGEWFVNVFLGQDVTLSAGAKLLAHGGIKLGDNVIVGEQAQLVTVGHPMHPRQRHLLLIGPLDVREGAIIGGGAIMMNTGSADPVSVGRHSIVLSGSIVSKSVPDYSVAGGVNKILLEGKEYFTDDVSSGVLARRLNDKGLAVLKEKAAALGLELPEDVCAKPAKLLPEGTRTITHVETRDLSKLQLFFPLASQEVLRLGLFFPPIYLHGNGQIILGNNMLINTGSLLKVDGTFELGDGSFLAPETEISVPEGSKLVIGKKVWIGAKVKVSVPKGETMTIGDGSVVAAGATVNGSLPAMSVVVGEGKIVDTLGDKNLHAVPLELNDFDNYENQRLRLREHIATMGIEQVKARFAQLCERPTAPARFKALARGL